MLVEDGSRSRGHALPLDVIRLQADSIGVPLLTRCASWEDYEGAFVDGLRELTEDGIDCGVFGDIDLEGHREWVERVCGSVGIDAYEPLWKRNRRDLLDEFFALGFKATIAAVKDSVLPADILGKVLSPEVIADMEELGADASGEKGEYHTIVTDGPVFSYPITIYPGIIVSRDGYHFLSVSSRR